MENFCRDNAGLDKSYEKFKQLCREALIVEEYNYLCRGRSKVKKSEGKYCLFNEIKNFFRMYSKEEISL